MEYLKAGDKAPPFKAADCNGNIHSIEEYKGEKILISFFRYASCPLCNQRVHNIIQVYDEWKKKKLRVLTIFESSAESISRYVQNNTPFPVIPDPNRKLYKLYQLESSLLKFIKGALPFIKAFYSGFYPGKMEGDRFIVPADFLVDREGILHTAYYGRHIGDHLSIHEINKFLNE